MSIHLLSPTQSRESRNAQVYLKRTTSPPAIASTTASPSPLGPAGTIVKPEKQAAKAQRKLLPRLMPFVNVS